MPNANVVSLLSVLLNHEFRQILVPRAAWKPGNGDGGDTSPQLLGKGHGPPHLQLKILRKKKMSTRNKVVNYNIGFFLLLL